MKKGFSLIEMMIVLLIMSTLSVYVARAITQAVKAKQKIEEQIDVASRLRDAIKLMAKDIQRAFHFQDWELELKEIIKKKGTPNTGSPPNPQQSALATPSPPPLTGNEAVRLDPVTHFIGSENQLYFVTMNQTRFSREEKQADFIEVGYFLKECKSADGKSTSQCLWRRSSNYVDDDLLKGGEELQLLENVTEFKLRYIGPGKQDWVSDWKTNTSQEAAIRNKFPTATEISITIEKKMSNGKNKKFSMQIVAPIHFPNNREESATTTTGAAASQQPGTPLNPTPGVKGP